MISSPLSGLGISVTHVLPVRGEIMMIQQLFIRALALFYVITTISF